MEMKYNGTGKERKQLVIAIAEITGARAVYKGAPTFAYEVAGFTIDKNGRLIFEGQADDEEIKTLLEGLTQKGFTAEQTRQESGITQNEQAEEEIGFTVQMPRNYFDDAQLENLYKLVESKSGLIKKALGISELPIRIEETKVSFPWFSIKPESSDAVSAYTHFIQSLCEMACKQIRINAKEKEVDNEKYAFRCFLLRLGFIGEGYKTERKLLLQNLSGSSAFKGGAKNGISE